MDNKKRVLKGSTHASPEMRRAELLKAAITCFGKSGYFSTTIDQIAKEAGLSKGSVYRFFKSKDDVLFAIISHYEEEIDTLIESELQTVTNPRDAIRVLLRTIIVYLSQHTEMERTWREFACHPLALEEYSRMINDVRGDMDQLLRQGIIEGLFIDQDTAPVVDILIIFQEGLLELSTNQIDFNSLERFDSSWPVLERTFIKPNLSLS